MKTNAIKRKVRLMRKLGLQRWDYFVTVTYFYGHSAYMTLRFIAFRTTFVAQWKAKVNDKKLLQKIFKYLN